MPVTPLYFSVGAPIHKRMSWPGCMLANVVADMPVGIGMICASLSYKRHAGLCKNPHDKLTQYSVGRADLYPIGRTQKWFYGVFAGAISHPLLDVLYHSDVRLIPWAQPGFLGLILPRMALR